MPLFWVCLSFVTGIVLSALSSLSVQFWLTLLISAALCVFPEIWLFPRISNKLRSNPLFRVPVSLLLAALALGGWRFQVTLPHITARQLDWYAGDEPVTVTGRIISYPEESSSGTVAILQAQTVQTASGTQAVDGKLELRLPAGFHLSYGDVLQMEGKLNTLLKEDSPPYQSYLARRSIYDRMQYPQVTTLRENAGSLIMAAIYAVRDRAQAIIYNQVPYPDSTLLCGILLGIDWNIPDNLIEAYRACGVLHIIAISGFNIALISGLVIRLTRTFFSSGKAGLIAILTILTYTLLVGAEPAVVRAAIMGSLAIPAHYFGRRVIALHSLVIVAAMMLAGNPFLLWDISFQLSFLACLGLTTMVDPLVKWIDKGLANHLSEEVRQWWRPILVMVVSTLIAQFCAAPALYEMNPQFSLWTLPANLALAIVQPLLMALGGSSLICGFFFPQLGQILAYAAWPFLAYCNKIALNYGFQPGAEIPLPQNFKWISTAAVAVALVCFSILQIDNFTNPKSS